MMELLDRDHPAAVTASARDDIALTAKLLQLANSAFFTRAEPVTTVARALSMLGLDVIRSLLRSTTSFRPGGAEAVHAEARCEAEADAGKRPRIARRRRAPRRSPLGRKAARRGPVFGNYLLGLWGLPEQMVAGLPRVRTSNYSAMLAAARRGTIQVSACATDSAVRSLLMSSRNRVTIAAALWAIAPAAARGEKSIDAIDDIEDVHDIQASRSSRRSTLPSTSPP